MTVTPSLRHEDLLATAQRAVKAAGAYEPEEALQDAMVALLEAEEPTLEVAVAAVKRERNRRLRQVGPRTVRTPDPSRGRVYPLYPQPDPEERRLQEAREGAVAYAFTFLPAESVALLRLRYGIGEEAQSVEQIARCTGLSMSAVERRLRSARRLLREVMEREVAA